MPLSSGDWGSTEGAILVECSKPGNATLIDNLGTLNGSRVVQLYNGRAEISVEHRGSVVASVISKDVNPCFLRIDGGQLA